ncbi:hypothetical protein JCM14076_10390 [Methylosoma difficile]
MSLKIAWKPVSQDRNVASARIRCLNVMDQLQKQAWPVSFFQANSQNRYDAVVFNKTHDHQSLEQAKQLKSQGIKVIFDLCDNYFYNPQQLPEVAKAAEVIQQMMQLADHTVASSEYLATCIAEHIDATKISIIEDAVDEILPLCPKALTYWQQLQKYQKLSDQIQGWRTEGRTCLVWFGIAGGGKADYGMGDLAKLDTFFNDATFASQTSLTVISNNPILFADLSKRWQIPSTYLPWHPSTFAHAFRLHDISIIPISQNPFTLAKTNNRLALSLHLGLPVIADSIPSYQALSEACFLDDWQNAFDTYLNNPNQRFAHVNQGRRLLLDKWSINHISQQWEQLFYRVTGS